MIQKIQELRSDHVDDDNYQHIDAYFDADDNSQGKTIAIVCLDTNKVYFLDNLYRTDKNVQEEIKNVLADNNIH